MGLLASTPQIEPTLIRTFLAQKYGWQVEELRPLPSERDQNFLVTSCSGERSVFKVVSGEDDRVIIEGQIAILHHIGQYKALSPTPIKSLSNLDYERIEDSHQNAHYAYMVTYLPGKPLANVRYHSPQLIQDFGRTMGSLDRILETFDHPAFHRKFCWSPNDSASVIHQKIHLVSEPGLRSNVDNLVRRFDRHAMPVLAECPKSIIHNDANDHNVLICTGPETTGDHVVGIIDFGDVVHTWTVADLATAIAYLILKKPDPLRTAQLMVASYHAERPLSEQELQALFGLVGMRLCTSVVMAAENMQQRPDDPYLAVSQNSIREILPQIQAISYGLATAAFRAACGYDPMPRSSVVIDWLRGKRNEFAFPLSGHDRSSGIALDLSVSSPLVAQLSWPITEPQSTDLIFTTLEEHDATFGYGGYLEPRCVYTSDQFLASDDEKQARTLHLGIDLFAKSGSEVVAPLAGNVVYAGTIDRALDYGTLVILEHRTDADAVFYTLYGHLARNTLDCVRSKQKMARGETIGWLGDPSENGGWTSHLHFQIILDLLDYEHDFPGVGQVFLADVWSSICPDADLMLGLKATDEKTSQHVDAPSNSLQRRSLAISNQHRLPAERWDATSKRRSQLFGGNVRLSYREPLMICRGRGSHLFSHDGRAYIDAYNNVPHVGHCHPEVVETAVRHMRVLNTNSRYLHEVPLAFAEQLLQTFDPSLDVCYFLNSASEANELALRLARNFTCGKDLIVLDGAYHGHTTTLIDISPYKHNGPGGHGPANWVHAVPQADIYRGPHRDPLHAGVQYAEHVAVTVDELNRSGRQLCGFIAESCPSVGGQIIFPENYLKSVYEIVRKAGGICIADDVQTGYGRLGTAFYGFELQGVIPDIVVLGKPMGNGHPLAAVVTRRVIADAFDDGMEFFSTFGGNTVSCAVGSKVLEIVQRDNLQQHALMIGKQLLLGFNDLKNRHAVIGDVRGSGLFLGIELVKEPTSLEPATAEASFIVNRMKDRGILIGTDGPLHNVLKIRPPLVFSERNATQLLDALSVTLDELP
ncbi:MAG TPA: aminotransferase class III-fold pyridoxal phosphate-dependent enzyme [Pirellulaceae bacterium]|nr:aminotransferase class III-fold pyridoxal phosphate-dependent enzyme [Pirellulaceae bacterium]HMO91578.1 aminotransferase class III-fold pyridoxal phosphate-dependent enzyme [Pirellulaceae bacterium]HMP68275.1 aminotransferase class III-fold pyridoxal phosphate-dependent enzyme [Pirellulaceae bacterium]